MRLCMPSSQIDCKLILSTIHMIKSEMKRVIDEFDIAMEGPDICFGASVRKLNNATFSFKEEIEITGRIQKLYAEHGGIGFSCDWEVQFDHFAMPVKRDTV